VISAELLHKSSSHLPAHQPFSPVESAPQLLIRLHHLALQHRHLLAATASSVGRISFTNKTGQHLLSGWVGQTGNNNFFISSSHGYVHDLPPPQGVVSFELYWDGDPPIQGEPPRVFFVTVERFLPATEQLVWKFDLQDAPHLPPPLTFSRAPIVGDYVVVFGFAIPPTQEKLAEYWSQIADPLIRLTTVPDVIIADAIYHPNQKIAAVGEISAAAPVSGNTLLAVRASMYHGMSGGPVVLVDANGVLGVCAEVIGNTHTSTLNSNTCLDVVQGPANVFLRNFMG